MSATFDPYYKWLGILPKDQPPHYYRLLGLEAFEDDLQVIEGAADRQLGYLRKHQSGEHAADCQKLLNEISRARLCLLRAESKAAYDAKLHQRLGAKEEFSLIDITSLPPVQAKPRKRTLETTADKLGLRSWRGKGAIAPAAIGGVLLLLVVGATLFRGRPKQPLPKVLPPAAVNSADLAQAAQTKSESPAAQGNAETPAGGGRPPSTPKTIDILPLLKQEHVIAGNWKINPESLESLGYTRYAQITLPVKAPAEYTIHVRGTRLETPDALSSTVGMMLVYGGYRTLFNMEALPDQGTSGLHLLDSQFWDLNQTYLSGFQTQIGKPFDLDTVVRKDGIEVRVDGRTIVDWQGNPSQLSLSDGWNQAPDGQLTLAGESNYVFTQLTLGPPLPRRTLPGADLKPGESVDLLPLVDLQRDVWGGAIVKDGAGLKTDTSFCCRFSVPFVVPDEYILTADIETDLPAREFHLGFPFQRGFAGTSLACGGGTSNYLIVDRQIPQLFPDRYVSGHLIIIPRTKLIAEVRNSHIMIKVGDQTIFDWRSDPRRFIDSKGWNTPGRQITFGSNKFSYRVHSLTLSRLPPSGPPFPPLAVPHDGDLLQIVDAARDSISGRWTTPNGVLTSTPEVLSGLRFPAKLPENYEFRLVAERKSGNDFLAINVPMADQSAMVVIDGDGGTSGGVEFINGLRFNQNPTAVRYQQPQFPVGVPQIVQGRMDGRHLQVSIDGKPFLDLDLPEKITDPAWAHRPGWLTPEERLQLTLTTNCSFSVRDVRFRSVEKDAPPFPPIDLAALRLAAKEAQATAATKAP
ncbi:MAG: hypothetical protein V4719_25215 [Planctomycetota bacterium]